jgi:hypothetical protein
MSISLSHLQHTFLTHVYTATNIPSLDFIQSSPSLPSTTAFAIYQHGIITRFQKVLKKIYSVCHALVGDDFFSGTTYAFIQQTPSRSPDINTYGQPFANFISQFAPAACLPYLADVARLEWASHHSFTAADDNPYDWQTINQEQPLTFLLTASSTLLATPYPIHRIWEVNQTDYQGDQTITIEPNKTYYLFIWRKNFNLCIDVISREAWQVLTWISAGFTLETMADLATTEKIDLPALLPVLITNGWIVGSDFTKPKG